MESRGSCLLEILDANYTISLVTRITNCQILSQVFGFSSTISIILQRNACFYSLDKDPYEKNNIFEDNKDTVWTLLEKLAQYDANSVPTYYPDRDPAADPAAAAAHGGDGRRRPRRRTCGRRGG